jgi:hypothetical protein
LLLIYWYEKVFLTDLQRIIVHTVQCIDYPVEIQRRIIAEGPAIDIQLGLRNADKSTRKTKTPSARKSAKKVAVVESETENSEDEGDEDDSEAEKNIS